MALRGFRRQPATSESASGSSRASATTASAQRLCTSLNPPGNSAWIARAVSAHRRGIVDAPMSRADLGGDRHVVVLRRAARRLRRIGEHRVDDGERARRPSPMPAQRFGEIRAREHDELRVVEMRKLGERGFGELACGA